MTFEINLIEEERAVRIHNEKGDYIVLDLEEGYNNMKQFLEESDL